MVNNFKRLNNLAMLSIESDITKTLDFKMILKDFAKLKSQKSLFLKCPCINSLSVIVLTYTTRNLKHQSSTFIE